MKPETLGIPHEPTITSDLVSRVIQGDEDASISLFRYMAPRIRGFHARRIPNNEEIKDRTQDTLISVFTHLPEFTNTGEGAFEENFKMWCFGFANNDFRQAGEIFFKRAEVPIDSIPEPFAEIEDTDEEPQQDLAELQEKFRLKIAEILSPDELELYYLRTSGGTNTSIAEIKQSTIAIIAQRVSGMRKKLDRQLLYPAGFKRLSSYKVNEQHSLRHAAQRGTLKAVKFMGGWYSQDEWIQQYVPSLPVLDQGFIDQGNLSLVSSVSAHEYFNRSDPQFSNLIVRHKGRLYIRSEDLEWIRQTRIIKRGLITPKDGDRNAAYEGLHYVEYQQIANAARRGEIPSGRRGQKRHIEKEDAKRLLLETIPSKPAIQRAKEKIASLEEDIVPFIAEAQVIFPSDFSEWLFALSDQDNPQNTYLELLGWLKNNEIELPDYLRPIAYLKLGGYKNNDLVERFAISMEHVKNFVSQLRTIIEDALVFPSGVKNLGVFEDVGALRQACRRKKLKGIQFLGRWYTTERDVLDYRDRVAS